MNQPMPQPGVDRRQHMRKPLRGQARLVVPGRPPIVARAKDISVSGLGVVAGVNLTPKVNCTVYFELMLRKGGLKAVQTSARIAQSIFSSDEDGFKVGLEFVALPTAARTTIDQYMDG